MEDLINIIKELKKFKELENLKYDDNQILICATKLFISYNIQNQKTINVPFPKEDFKLKNPNDSATEKQIFLIKKMGVDIPKNMTKLEASKLIQEAKRKQGEEIWTYKNGIKMPKAMD